MLQGDIDTCPDKDGPLNFIFGEACLPTPDGSRSSFLPQDKDKISSRARHPKPPTEPSDVRSNLIHASNGPDYRIKLLFLRCRFAFVTRKFLETKCVASSVAGSTCSRTRDRLFGNRAERVPCGRWDGRKVPLSREQRSFDRISRSFHYSSLNSPALYAHFSLEESRGEDTE